jgi:hypothetical protein
MLHRLDSISAIERAKLAAQLGKSSADLDALFNLAAAL